MLECIQTNRLVIAFAYGLSAELERNLISQRTKEAVAREKAEGIILGRLVAKLLEVDIMTLCVFIKEMDLIYCSVKIIEAAFMPSLFL